MNISKFTQKSIQAVQDLEKVAYEYGNQEVEQEHLLYALLSQEDSLSYGRRVRFCRASVSVSSEAAEPQHEEDF